MIKEMEAQEFQHSLIKAKILDGMIQDPQLMSTTCEK
jgi:hypothetical protein